jgi:hypothetical protein
MKESPAAKFREIYELLVVRILSAGMNTVWSSGFSRSATAGDDLAAKAA